MARCVTGVRRIVAGLALAALGACETVPPLPPPEGTPEQAWQVRLQTVESLDSWLCTGRLGVTDGNEGFSASLRWQQVGDGYEIRLTGPLGQGLAHVSGTPGGVAMRTSDQGTLVAPTPEALLEQSFGWPLPISGLRYWILGISMPDMPVDSRELDRWGRLVLLEQSGWHIRYMKYTRVNGVDLPSSMKLARDTLSARISVSRWEPGL